ncbi:unnamed protein product [Bursaphelenchus xylophilus]|uniref:(pine wood nematode) hypothetical protein n=1 Tax=Bursaphelenchus xylophilus TaxID=6326 RepID=A0A1I7RM73_BURXY|nr:unnamed protein product [Bursaphelenchus xylophilus]CAG9118265.1 unnamed protein product [Bursaphelenchus xylophilus]
MSAYRLSICTNDLLRDARLKSDRSRSSSQSGFGGANFLSATTHPAPPLPHKAASFSRADPQTPLSRKTTSASTNQQLAELIRQSGPANSAMILPVVKIRRKSLLANVSSVLFLLSYLIFGGYTFMYFEADAARRAVHENLQKRYTCIDAIFMSRPYDASVAIRIAQECVADPDLQKIHEWNLKNALLYGFGILTTLGYGKIETKTSEGKVFTVIWGIMGVPITVIILSNFGLYLRHLEHTVRHWFLRRWRERCDREKSPTLKSLRIEPVSNELGVSPISLLIVVILYLIFGAVVMPLLNGRFDFVNGLYYSYICFTAIEFGALVPERTEFIPVVIGYMIMGLAISTVAVELGAVYVKKLYFVGRKAGNFQNVQIWFGSKKLHVTELLSALSQTIGIDPDTFAELDLDQLVKDAILVKEGKLDRIPQAYIFLEGIWPPALVPLFLRDGGFPEYVDADVISTTDEKMKKLQRTVSMNSYSVRRQIAYRDLPQTEPDDEDSNNNIVLEY